MEQVLDHFISRLKCDGWDVQKINGPVGLLDENLNAILSPENDTLYRDTWTCKSRRCAIPNPTPDELYFDIVNQLHADYEEGFRKFYIYMIIPCLRPSEKSELSDWGYILRYDRK